MADLLTAKWRIGFLDGSGPEQVRTDEATPEHPKHTGSLVCDSNKNHGCGCCGGEPEEPDLKIARQIALLPDLYRAASSLLEPTSAPTQLASMNDYAKRAQLRDVLKKINDVG